MVSVKLFLVSLVFLFSAFEIFGRELQCSYSTDSWGNLWPTFHRCVVTSVDLSETYRLESFSFIGTPTEKSQTTVIEFESGVSTIDFIPKHFQNLNGLAFDSYKTPTIKNDLFTEEFKAIEYLYLGQNEIHLIEENAFKHLFNLKWVHLGFNQINSLPFQIFKNNPELVYLNFYNNKIVSINTNFFDGLNKLKYIEFYGNQCIDSNFGCETCSVPQPTLKLEFSSCFTNCRSDLFCSSQIQTTTQIPSTSTTTGATELAEMEAESLTTQAMTTELIETTEAGKTNLESTMVPEVIDSTSRLNFDITETVKKEVDKFSSDLVKMEEKAAEKFGELKENILKIFF